MKSAACRSGATDAQDEQEQREGEITSQGIIDAHIAKAQNPGQWGRRWFLGSALGRQFKYTRQTFRIHKLRGLSKDILFRTASQTSTTFSDLLTKQAYIFRQPFRFNSQFFTKTSQFLKRAVNEGLRQTISCSTDTLLQKKEKSLCDRWPKIMQTQGLSPAKGLVALPIMDGSLDSPIDSLIKIIQDHIPKYNLSTTFHRCLLQEMHLFCTETHMRPIIFFCEIIKGRIKGDLGNFTGVSDDKPLIGQDIFALLVSHCKYLGGGE
jgi:hypothetical protein